MAQVTLSVNGRPYVVGCEDGQEAHLTELARLFDAQVQQVSKDVGQLGETRLFLMAALLLADELSDLRGRLAGLQADHARLQSEAGSVEGRAVAALEAAARRVEKLAGARRRAPVLPQGPAGPRPGRGGSCCLSPPKLTQLFSLQAIGLLRPYV